jgi:hypothetical protein
MRLPGLHGERELEDEWILTAVVAEGDVAELERLGRGPRSGVPGRARRGAHTRLVGIVQHVVEAREVALQRLHLLRRVEERLHWRREPPRGAPGTP